MRRWIALVLLAVALAVGIFAISRACADDDDNTSPPTTSGSGTPSPPPELISESTREVQGIELTVVTDDETYDSGDEIPVRAVVKNNRPDVIQYRTVVPAEPPFRLEVVAPPFAGEQMLDTGEDPPTEGELQPGDELEIEATWDQMLDIDQDPIQAPPGRYSIKGTFIATLGAVPEPVVVETAVTFEIEGGERVLPPVEVLAKAIGTDEFKQWAEGRATNVVCLYPPTGLFYQGFITNGTSAETFDFLYTSQQANGLPICGIGTDGEAWRLNFYSQKGEAPNRFNMLLDLNDGSLIATEEPTPPPSTPAPSP